MGKAFGDCEWFTSSYGSILKERYWRFQLTELTEMELRWGKMVCPNGRYRIKLLHAVKDLNQSFSDIFKNSNHFRQDIVRQEIELWLTITISWRTISRRRWLEFLNTSEKLWFKSSTAGNNFYNLSNNRPNLFSVHEKAPKSFKPC